MSQALCQGELGAVLSQSSGSPEVWSRPPQGYLKNGGKWDDCDAGPVGGVDCRGSLSAVWGSTLGPMRLQPSKVRVPWGGAWRVLSQAGPPGSWKRGGWGPCLGGHPALIRGPVGASLIAGSDHSSHQYPPFLPRVPLCHGRWDPAGAPLNLYLTPGSVRKERLHPRASELASARAPQ